MESILRIPLQLSTEQVRRLQSLQHGFAQLCNALAPTVQATRVWNRVALHHLSYRQLREQFPAMGSQMVCNAIYSVSRTCRALFKQPASPFHLEKLGDKPLPLLRFTDSCPVYFDRHTLSLKEGKLSMFTLDGRMRFQLSLDAQDEQRFHELKMREIVLAGSVMNGYTLTFVLADSAEETKDTRSSNALSFDSEDTLAGEIPEYILVEEKT